MKRGPTSVKNGRPSHKGSKHSQRAPGGHHRPPAEKGGKPSPARATCTTRGGAFTAMPSAAYDASSASSGLRSHSERHVRRFVCIKNSRVGRALGARSLEKLQAGGALEARYLQNSHTGGAPKISKQCRGALGAAKIPSPLQSYIPQV